MCTFLIVSTDIPSLLYYTVMTVWKRAPPTDDVEVDIED